MSTQPFQLPLFIFLESQSLSGEENCFFQCSCNEHWQVKGRKLFHIAVCILFLTIYLLLSEAVNTFKTTKNSVHIPEKFKCHSLCHCQLYQFLPTVISLDLCKCCKSTQLSDVQTDSKDCKNSCISIGFCLIQ